MISLSRVSMVYQGMPCSVRGMVRPNHVASTSSTESRVCGAVRSVPRLDGTHTPSVPLDGETLTLNNDSLSLSLSHRRIQMHRIKWLTI